MEGLFHAHIVDRGFCTLQAESSNFRVCSLSSDLHDIRLWAHYASGHHGVAIEFQPRELVKEVKYSDTPYIFASQEHEKHAELLVKLNGWKHEKEYRYITQSEDQIYLAGHVKSLVFGIRTPEVVREFICSFCDQVGITTYETKLNHQEYKIELIKTT